MGKESDKFVALAKLEFDEIMARCPSPESEQSERAAKIAAELSALDKANPSRDELIQEVAELRVMREDIPNFVRFLIFATGAFEAIEEDRREAGQRGAEALHKKMGTKGKVEQLHQIWASGKYRSRDECAKCEHEKLGLGLSTARRALRKTPEPARRRG